MHLPAGSILTRWIVLQSEIMVSRALVKFSQRSCPLTMLCHRPATQLCKSYFPEHWWVNAPIWLHLATVLSSVLCHAFMRWLFEHTNCCNTSLHVWMGCVNIEVGNSKRLSCGWLLGPCRFPSYLLFEAVKQLWSGCLHCLATLCLWGQGYSYRATTLQGIKLSWLFPRKHGKNVWKREDLSVIIMWVRETWWACPEHINHTVR